MTTHTLATQLMIVALSVLAAAAPAENASAQTTVQNVEQGEQEQPRASQIPEAVLTAFSTSLQQNDDFLTALYKAMHAADDGSFEGIAYFLSGDNELDTNWLVQTPNVWGMKAGHVRRGAGAYVVKDVQTLVQSAEHFIDITSLGPFPTGQFENAIKQGLLALAKSSRPVTVRILVGWPTIVGTGPIQAEYLSEIIGSLKRVRTGNLKIFVGAQRSSVSSWNHAKMVAVDGKRVFLGGENLWDRDYLQFQPVHDLNVALQGSIAFGMHQFADKIWESVCDYIRPDWKAKYWATGMKDIDTGCLARNGLPRTKGPGNLAVLGAGRLSKLASNGDAADVAMVAALNASNSVIRMSQQDLGMLAGRLWWEPGMSAIARALVARQDVYIVLSNDNARAGPDGTSYTTGVGIRETANRIKRYVSEQSGAPSGSALIDLLCSHLHLTTLRFGPSDHWPKDSWQFANHAKFFMIDDRVFYVGSENLYPSDLVEYGVFISDSAAVRQIREQYWEKLWQYSSRVAISGNEARKCYFRD